MAARTMSADIPPGGGRTGPNFQMETDRLAIIRWTALKGHMSKEVAN